MSYTVLARKWRPKNFAELVGQSHVMQALSNALDQQRLHHAYLFTGTRGVGKTTIARIFAKALNCQEGISSSPCGVCDTCRSIDEGRFIDLIEVDAASKTKVDDTREILDNVQFAPTQGRYKVYLIDEVHMLSKSSFNALLKTLEEPPEHVKFLLATTDPHKLPITVLSRCLQFNLMRLTQPQIQGHLAHILGQENIPFEDSALALIAKSADGSARDSLSLLDQAIAYGAGEVMFEPVQTMLGLVDQQFGVAILQALANNDAQQIKNVIQQLASMGVDYQALLAQLIESLHAISYVQVFADNETTTLLPAEIVKSFADNIEPERVQLLYQIALLTKQDMQLAPDIRIGFEMALMRMLAFQPAQSQSGQSKTNESNVANKQAAQSPNSAAALNDESGLSPMDALASLATARSLVGKKNTSINPETMSLSEDAQNSVNKNANQIKDDQLSLASSNVHDVSGDLSPKKIQEPDLQESYAEASLQATVKESFNESFKQTSQEADSEINHHSTAQVQEKPAAVAATDHLTQIRERLKQPFAKPVKAEAQSSEIPSAPDVVNNVVFEDSSFHAVDELEERAAPNSTQVTTVNIEHRDSNDSIDTSTSHESSSWASVESNQPLESIEKSESPELISPGLISSGSKSPGSKFPDSKFPQSVSHAEIGMNQSDISPVETQEYIHENTVQQSDKPLNLKAKDGQLGEIIEDEIQDVIDENFVPSNDALKDWLTIIERLNLKGMANDMARNSVLVAMTENTLQMSIDPEQQYAKPEMVLEQIDAAVKAYFGSNFSLEVVQANEHFTPVKLEQKLASDKQQAAQQSIESDSVVNALISNLGMEVIPGTLKPI
ncbi:DNA polymerase III subunit gamma/tau [Thiomicrorhabdus sp. Milos-T2]|uniref:DNA polymerase III subunit gamma/tau n=1 Tax=Thiomicrorhabdus sp. Milos-T2 TaxID=90814 RepID=UPI00068F7B2B|nr:DNA polymerase III subunit gamma/tau [Thiomicrorhabdus sp. Milos-T2]